MFTTYLLVALTMLAFAAEKFVDDKLAAKAEVVLRVEFLKATRADKYAWYRVEVLQVLKNESSETFTTPLSIAAYSWKDGVPEGESTVYLERYNKSAEAFWMLVGGEASSGVSHLRKTGRAARSTNAPALGPVIDRAPASKADEAVWGEPVEGVSVRLRADTTTWTTNETPSFKLDVRNQGQREFSTPQSQESGRLEVDGVWYGWTGAIDLKGSWLPSGREYHDIVISLGTNWMATHEWRDKTQAPVPQIPLKVIRGKHTIRFAPEIRDTTVKPEPQNKYVPSNPVEIEITGDMQGDNDLA